MYLMLRIKTGIVLQVWSPCLNLEIFDPPSREPHGSSEFGSPLTGHFLAKNPLPLGTGGCKFFKGRTGNFTAAKEKLKS